jgi:hypothetical protein
LKKINIEEYNKYMAYADIAFMKEMKENREKHNLDTNLEALDIYDAVTVSPDGSYFCLNSILIMRENNIVEVLQQGFGRPFVCHSVGVVFMQ